MASTTCLVAAEAAAKARLVVFPDLATGQDFKTCHSYILSLILI